MINCMINLVIVATLHLKLFNRAFLYNHFKNSDFMQDFSLSSLFTNSDFEHIKSLLCVTQITDGLNNEVTMNLYYLAFVQ